jgi:exopolysaccharide production protein ExoZ
MRKRIVRIVPLYWLALLWAGRRSSLETDLVADFLFIPRHNNEWPDMIAPIVQQGWTLNYEMFFYTIFAVAILCGPLRLFATLSFLIALAVTGLLFGPDGLAGIFYTDSIVLEFGFGIILQRYLTRFPAWKRSTYLALIALGFVMLALGYHQEPRAFFQGLPALLIVWASFKGFDRCMRLPSVKLLGDASYAIYLFHWASFGAFNPVARLIGPDQVTMLMLGYIATGIVSGVLIHLLIEKPLTPIASRVMGLKRHIDKPPRAAPATP